MAFIRPSLPTILSNGLAYVASYLGYTPAPGSFEYIIVQLAAGLADSIYSFIDYAYKNSVPFTARLEYLRGWGNYKNVNPLPATYAIGSLSFMGMAGSVIPLGSLLVASNNQQYATNAQFVVGSVGYITATAVIAGSVGNLPSGAVMSLVTPIAGVTTQTSAATAFTGGTDTETDAAYSARVLLAWQTLSSGGNLQDFKNWALAGGASRAWVIGDFNPGAGTVTVFVMDATNNGNDGFPIGTDGVATNEPRNLTKATGFQLIIANYILPLQPIPAAVWVQAPDPFAITVAITGLGLTNSYNLLTGWANAPTTIEANILASLQDMLLIEGTALGGVINVSDIYEAIGAVAGATNFTLTTPTSVISTPLASLPIIGTLTFS